MPLAPGTRLGSFEIVTQIGAGGMGEVYRARDLNLKRDVAIKVLPDAFAREPARISRFEREATLLASLNHGNIATVYDFQHSGERHFLVMGLVEGDTLADRLARGPIPYDTALGIARQVAEGLEAAHERGIIHRDSKPANIKVGADGRVKILDFGLAKIFETAGGSGEQATSTGVLGDTAVGVVLGTVGYMSPEQARGQPVDARTDIWALGCVIYEMLSGRPAFASGSPSDTIAAVLRAEPDWDRLPHETSPQIRLLLERCLRKDARRRLHAAADVRLDLEEAAGSADRSADRSAPPSRGSRLAGLLPIMLALVAGAVVASTVWWVRLRTSSEIPALTHLNLTSVPRTAPAIDLNANHRLAISPDGRNIVYVADGGGKRQLYLRPLADAHARPIDGTEGARTAFFSPDGQWIAFGNDQELKKVAVSGGSPITICKLSSTAFYGGDWGPDNTIVFVPDYDAGLWTVSANGGTPQPLLGTDPGKAATSYADPEVLPNGGGILLTVASGRAVTADDLDVAVLGQGAREPRILIHGGCNARYLPTGHIVYVHDGRLLSVAFDLNGLAVTGTPVPVMTGLARTWSGDADYAISNTGTLVYEPDTGVKSGTVLAMVDSTGARPTHHGARQLRRVFGLPQRAIHCDEALCDQRRHLGLRHRDRHAGPAHVRAPRRNLPEVDARRHANRLWHAHRPDLLAALEWHGRAGRTRAWRVSPLSRVVFAGWQVAGLRRNPPHTPAGYLADVARGRSKRPAMAGDQRRRMGRQVLPQRTLARVRVERNRAGRSLHSSDWLGRGPKAGLVERRQPAGVGAGRPRAVLHQGRSTGGRGGGRTRQSSRAGP